jgi:hypothetical protein
MQGAKVIKDLRHLADRWDEAEVRQALFRFGEDNFAVGMVSTVYREVAIYSFDQRLDVICHGPLKAARGHGCCA